ncbi:cytochrome c-type biogenesis protein CcmH, partial [Pseudomonas syringae]|nr:cytochrome c-type biogenesis protein CcmH [Pseudomonas syringae]
RRRKAQSAQPDELSEDERQRLATLLDEHRP